ncbi:hypothetical protein HY025_05175 [Candidatus Daviesbacteria bacterium]|nr:hypothetical protein [Candidatus Daviesbacteria bacterium]
MLNKKGYIALSMVLILTAVVIAISVTVALLSIGEGQSALALSKGEDALTFAEGCAEDALLKSRNSTSYSGGTIGRPGTEGTCSVTVSKAGSTWTITSTTNAASPAYKRTIQNTVTQNGYGVTINAGGWKEQ